MSLVARRPTPAQTDAMAAFEQQLQGIRQRFVDADRQDEHFALYGVNTPQPSTAGISIDEWGALLNAVTARLRFTVGEMRRPDVNDTPAAVRQRVLECADALDQLHAMLGNALSAYAPAEWRDGDGSPPLGTRRTAARPHVSAVPVSTPPLRRRARAALAND